jgi:hypothetical protein
MDGTGPMPATAITASTLEAMVHALEQEMPQLQLRSDDVFALAHAWAERHDAILALAPPAFRAAIEARIDRIGIRWGLSPGARVTREFPALCTQPRVRRRAS